MSRLRRRDRRVTPAFDHGEPIKDFSILPILIFVAVITLILLQTYKPKTHALVIDLPFSSAATPYTWSELENSNTIRIDRTGAHFWNGESVGLGELVTALELTTNQTPTPFLSLQPNADAPYETVAKMLNLISAMQLADDKFCIDGLRQHRDFNKDHSGVNPTMTRSIAKLEKNLKLHTVLLIEDESDPPIPPERPNSVCDALAVLP